MKLKTKRIVIFYQRRKTDRKRDKNTKQTFTKELDLQKEETLIINRKVELKVRVGKTTERVRS